ncbi:MAG TPA: methyltransferase domain-containing protein [Leptolyngbyaceae cyanobacterium M33_DOE_097]|uniref:Class I SAM-dependent methyltransferase n=1 Tax=Oscillatoriales cyanobacterium SpSt-418 TaxID=2282169 RepID=A0A7C3KDT4_9CYAN|nr:methyltransferase domain-containing protein [Leptolyngbyaceae cyanobacterium M33_DOE_097]
MSDSSQLYEMNPLERFSDRAAAYAKYRPTYPAQAIDAVLTGLKPPAQLVIADIGAGTGISSHLFAERGAKVYAVEPNAEMRQMVKPHSQITCLPGTAEKTGLAIASVDLVTCFQSFHWFQPELSLQEFHRILRSQGRTALVWNDKDLSDAFTAHYRNLIREASNNDLVEERKSDALSSETLAISSLFKNFRLLSFPNSQITNLDGLIGRAKSTSYVPQGGDKYQKLVKALEQLHKQFTDESGNVALKYQTRVYLAEAVAKI